ncbi:hypothetical protein ABB07_35960 [Streptomyces incarnatus]|uniref:histidine kinase n=1 Tax=Streptomyces incarnatus TaxID=665007 RepID=A0ABM5TWJ8_9ACTN|nr:hypothetical protein [Streptomyces incarnatus]AKJ15263.1 hypothetical protein ABB07_35960 [Streptomyces incarnatus]
MTCAVEVDGRAAPPAGMQVSAYRIVQEALANVVKHAGPVAVRIAVRGDDARLTVEVENDPPARATGRCPAAGGGWSGCGSGCVLTGLGLENRVQAALYAHRAGLV